MDRYLVRTTAFDFRVASRIYFGCVEDLISADDIERLHNILVRMYSISDVFFLFSSKFDCSQFEICVCDNLIVCFSYTKGR